MPTTMALMVVAALSVLVLATGAQAVLLDASPVQHAAASASPPAMGHHFVPPLAQDLPYVEDVSMRLTTTNATEIAGWGVLPVPDVVQVAAGVFGGTHGTWILSSTALYFAALPPTPYGTACDPVLPPTTAPVSSFTRVDTLLGVSLAPGSRVAVDAAAGDLVALVTPTAAHFVTCAEPSQCKATAHIAGSFGSVADVSAGAKAGTVWVACVQGLASVSTSGLRWVVTPGYPITAVAVSPDGTEVSAGSAQKFFLVDTASQAVVRWEWVTLVATGTGGVVDDAITSLAYDACGSVWIGNPVCVNVMFPDRSFIRISGLQGLPFNNVTSVARDYGTLPGIGAVGDMWVGTGQGVARYSPADHQCVSPDHPSRVGDWKYYWGRRWIPGNNVTSVSSAGNSTYVGTNGGIARVQHETWTLARKAALFAKIVPRHDRHGYTADCSLPTIGNLSGIQCHPGESDGLWTGIMANSEALRYAVKQDAVSASLAARRMAAMDFLSQVTGIGGYMARTTAERVHWPFGNYWYNSTSYPDWSWMGNTSADEVVGHMFAFQAAQALLGNATGQAAMLRDRIHAMVGYILTNDYFLIGHDHERTKWGIWAPSYVNGLRSWSDQRGLNAMQMLCFLNVAYTATGNQTFMDAIDTLSNSTNQYDVNQVNLKIEAPCDDNFSDSELAFLPFYSYTMTNASASDTIAGLTRSFNFARKERSSLYSSIYMAATGIADGAAVADVVWNLQTWPLEWVNWEARNSQRIDVWVNPQVNRDMQHGTMSVRVLPCNERNQFRWNHNPFTLDGGSGTAEFDPGAWLAPYWMARYHGILADA